MKTCIKDNGLVHRVKNDILKSSLIEKGDTVVAALSGGADSVCMLYILNKLKHELGFSLVAAHLNHGIRGMEAKRDEEFAKSFCKNLGIEIFLRYKDIPMLSKGKNTEMVGREERYAFFAELAGRFQHSKIAVAHNKNDLAETVVMRLIRGSSVFGLKGIPVKNEIIIRPLLSVTREEIESFLREEDLSYVTDSSNLEDDYTRNKIRHNILPEMNRINEGYLNSVANTARRLSTVSDFVKESAKNVYGEINEIISIEKIKMLHRALKEYIISESAYKAGVGELSEKNIEDIMELFSSPSGKKINLAGGYNAIKIYSEIKFAKQNAGVKEYYKELVIGRNYIKEADYTVEIIKSNRGIDIGKTDFPLYARPKKSGDFIEIKGLDGRKKIKKLYTDEKLPVDERDKYPLIVSGDKVVFALGKCGKEFISDENSKDAYTIKITKGKNYDDE